MKRLSKVLICFVMALSATLGLVACGTSSSGGGVQPTNSEIAANTLKETYQSMKEIKYFSFSEMEGSDSSSIDRHNAFITNDGEHIKQLYDGVYTEYDISTKAIFVRDNYDHNRQNPRETIKENKYEYVESPFWSDFYTFYLVKNDPKTYLGKSYIADDNDFKTTTVVVGKLKQQEEDGKKIVSFTFSQVVENKHEGKIISKDVAETTYTFYISSLQKSQNSSESWTTISKFTAETLVKKYLVESETPYESSFEIKSREYSYSPSKEYTEISGVA